MIDLAETAVQAALIDRLTQSDLGWTFVASEALNRSKDTVLVEPSLVSALTRLNPEIAQNPERVEEVLPRIRASILAVINDGLISANEEMCAWLCGRRVHRFANTKDYVPIRLIDFDDVRANELVVSKEVTYAPGHDERRYDLVLYVNGVPIVVGETKTPISTHTSWLNGANDIYLGYEEKTPAFFVPNVLSFATEGKEFRYGAVRQPGEMWLPWSKTTDELPMAGLKSVIRSAELLLAPETLIDILRTFTLFSRRSSTAGGFVVKVIPRYPQVEAVQAIVGRVRDSNKKQGLVWHHQGSGKTLVMAFASAKLRQQEDLDAPTILIVLDRLDLIDQVETEFASVGIPGLKMADSKDDLRRLLSEDARGVIVTTIFRFKDAGLLNDRSNIVVMVDEAHRTQEGRLGLDMREALPYAKFIGLTGTPISTDDRNTWITFGDADDTNGVLNHYSVERSIADGATLPIHVETRLVDFSIDHEALDQAFAELAKTEGLDDRESGIIAARASRVSQLMKNPDRVTAVCTDIVNHYRGKVQPLGLKAQVVAYDRELCVEYYNEITKQLGSGEEATVVMTTAKGDPLSWSQWDRDRDAEARVKDRFRDTSDPLRFLIVTSKLLTGFDAPIEGVMYLDKPLRAHTLFQAVCRTNRRWTNPQTSQEKLHGLIVDYVGMGNELAKAVAVRDTGSRKALPTNVDALVDVLGAYITQCMIRFEGIDKRLPGFEQLYQAQNRLPDKNSRDAFAYEFMRAEGLFEFLWPHAGLKRYEDDFRWLARIYKSVMPTGAGDELLWQRLGAKTAKLINEHVGGVTVDGRGLETVAVDAGVFEALRLLNLFPDAGDGVTQVAPTLEEILTRLEGRLAHKLASDSRHVVWVSLAERLEALRKSKVDSAAASVEFLKQLLSLAKDLLTAEKAEADGHLDDLKVIDPDKGALTQILAEFAPPDVPVIIETVVEKIDAIVRPVRNTGWQESQPGDRAVRQQLRIVLAQNGLPPQGEVFDRAYAYIREHY